MFEFTLPDAAHFAAIPRRRLGQAVAPEEARPLLMAMVIYRAYLKLYFYGELCTPKSEDLFWGL